MEELFSQIGGLGLILYITLKFLYKLNKLLTKPSKPTIWPIKPSKPALVVKSFKPAN